MKIFQIVVGLMLITFVGCVTVPFTVGDQPDAVPPKIVMSKDKNKIWDRAGAFGPIPADLQEKAKAVCGQNDMKAIGYHPKAQDENGNAFEGGGYLCVPK